ncbi:glycosyltransferase family 2 protein [Parabacteroides pacaensis]|uniref:glycosyltransferase family 2 protein n=1 Tax=Parabacteroides pacaensis TaxID=2086575 RepID=UPI000D0E8AC2|nr:glycosyltransferase family 2 protein [Parabacteroides pacaensis]
MKKVAVIILNWNGQKLMERFLPSVIRYTPEEISEVVVADNASTDESLPFLKANYPQLRTIVFDRNYGFAEGYNRAIAAVEAEYIVLLNSDVEVTEGWLDAPLQALDSTDQLAAVQPKIIWEQDRKHFEYAGAAGGFIDRYGYPFCRGRILHKTEIDTKQYNTPCDVLWATGACLIIRREVFLREGGLDKGFFAHQEEIDLCWRLRCRGYRLQCIPQSVVYHVGGGTLNAESPRKTFFNFRNNLLMLYKNLPEKDLRTIFRIRFWSDYLAAFKLLLTGHPANAFAVYRARKAFHKMKKEYKPIREENLRKRVNTVIPEIYNKSLLIAFYFRGKNKFSSFTDFP